MHSRILKFLESSKNLDNNIAILFSRPHTVAFPMLSQ